MLQPHGACSIVRSCWLGQLRAALLVPSLHQWLIASSPGSTLTPGSSGLNGFCSISSFLPTAKLWLSMKASPIPEPMAPCLPCGAHHQAADPDSQLAYGSPVLSPNKDKDCYCYLQSVHYVPGLVQAPCGQGPIQSSHSRGHYFSPHITVEKIET